MKTNMKIVSLLMAAAITTGVGGFGTYAYLTDTEDVKNDVNITMGTIDFTSNWQAGSQWNVVSAQNEAIGIENGTLNVSNVKPGDTFYREITVKNEGSLKGDMSINLNDTFINGFEVDMQVWNGDQLVSDWGNARYENLATEVGAEYTVQLAVKVNSELGNEWMGTGGKFDAHNFVTIGAHQVIR